MKVVGTTNLVGVTVTTMRVRGARVRIVRVKVVSVKARIRVVRGVPICSHCHAHSDGDALCLQGVQREKAEPHSVTLTPTLPLP